MALVGKKVLALYSLTPDQQGLWSATLSKKEALYRLVVSENSSPLGSLTLAYFPGALRGHIFLVPDTRLCRGPGDATVCLSSRRFAWLSAAVPPPMALPSFGAPT